MLQRFSGLQSVSRMIEPASDEAHGRVAKDDHVAAWEGVIACDMAATSLDDDSLDVAVFSLSLMGTNWARVHE